MSAEPSPIEILHQGLLADAEAHEAGQYDGIGERYDDVYRELLPMDDIKRPGVALALEFWDGWADARNHDWQYYEGIGEHDWPRLAREVVDSLRSGIDPTNPVLLKHFEPKPRRPLRERLRDRLRGRGAE